MKVLNYCLECKRVFESVEKCEFCNSDKIKALKKGTSVSIIGTKTKGSVFAVKGNVVSVILSNESKERVIKEYNISNLKKVL